MAANSTEIPSSNNNTSTDFTSPVSILPLAISLATLVAIIVAGCVLYRKRQRRRTLELTRQLQVTERRIDAIETLKAKKEQELEARKAEYQPPASAKSSSVSSLGGPFDVDTRVSLGRSMRKHDILGVEIQTENTAGDIGNLYYSNQSAVVDPNTAMLAHVPVSVIDEGASLYYCSTCAEGSSSSAVTSMATQSYTNQEGVNSSMAVECGTIPSVSSLSTIHTATKAGLNPRRSQSEGHSRSTRLPTLQRPPVLGAAHYSHNTNINTRPPGRRITSKYPHPPIRDLSNPNIWGRTISSNKARSKSISTAYMGITPLHYHSALSAMGLPEEVIMDHGGKGRPNTPVTSTSENSTLRSEDTDGQREKWV